MKKLNLYLNDDQYEKLTTLAKESNMEFEEYANEVFYDHILAKWLKRQIEEVDKIINNPNTDWED